ncbi:adhesion G-protein coupled receptor G2-like [Mugil cephalus]|uniref:adhesion G-protein coupled receptor G2-like n=1 Tax=Mugil cephalus TaxID=48193 RepID=UPI001FB70EB0|nr:adhesion G-protein coupled receptor G2-like [Mugil cephalus]
MSKLDPNCTNCDSPVQEPDEKVQLHVDLQNTPEGAIDPKQAAQIVNLIGNIVSSLNGSSAELSVGEGVSGILVKQTHVEDAEEVSFGYANPNQSINIIQDREFLTGFSRSVTVSKEAFQQAFNSSNSTFAAVFRFINMAEDEKNSTVLGDEVLAIEMGTKIANLTDTININFKNMKYKGIPACHSWDGKGAKPNWTEDGCVTNITGRNITCQCTHLTFFAILLTPLNETISSTDLKNLNIITQVGCGLSMFFLGIVLFMHFLTRRKKASKSTRILVHLVSAMFFLDFAFLINNYVARLNNTWACKIMAAVMHYFLLATFTWFAVQAFHLCLQLYMAGKIVIHRYILKVSVTSWIIPSLIVVVLLIVGKYGQQIVQADNAENAESLCWITDTDIHYIVNIGYYVVVFLFTFTTFIIVVSWLFCLKNPKLNGQVSQNGKSILTIMGLCCILGITWGFAFLAYGVLRIPSYYIFTILNSFQGFFLFIYYYNTSHTGEANAGAGEQSNLSSTSSISSSTLNTSLETTVNPYHNIRRNLSFLK